MSSPSSLRYPTALAALALAGALAATASAHATTVYDAYGTPGGGGGVQALDGATLAKTGGFTTAFQPVSLAAGADSLYVDAGHAVARYDLAGNLLQFDNTGGAFTPGAMAFGANQLYVAYDLPGGVSGVDILDPTTLGELGKGFALPGHVTSLAFGANSLFVAYSHALARYDLSGGLMDFVNTGPNFTPGALAYGDGILYAAFTGKFGATGVDYIHPDTLLDAGGVISLAGLPVGLAFGGHDLFVAHPTGLTTYSAGGLPLKSVNTGTDLLNGPLAVMDTGAGVPEPSTWLLMLAGFGGIGLAARRRQAPRAA